MIRHGSRICKLCENQFELEDDAEPGELYACESCEGIGEVTLFPCAEKDCNCGGFLSIRWIGVNYAKRKPKKLTFEAIS